LKWKQATVAQLYEIAYNDTMAPLEYRLSAGQEIKRRARRREKDRVNIKLKAMYR
jgi:hypothetical protein